VGEPRQAGAVEHRLEVLRLDVAGAGAAAPRAFPAFAAAAGLAVAAAAGLAAAALPRSSR